MVQAEFSPVNCTFLPLTPVNCPCQMPSDEFKNQLRNIKYFLYKGNLDVDSNLCNRQQSNFRKNFIKLSVVDKNTSKSITFASFFIHID